MRSDLETFGGDDKQMFKLFYFFKKAKIDEKSGNIIKFDA